MGLSNYDPGQELSSINFGGLIGGSLTSVVEAQSLAALSTINFIKSVGFNPDTVDDTTGVVTPGTPIYVTFKYPKMVSPYVPAVTGGAVGTVSVATAGTGYTVGDTLTLAGGSASVKVDSISGTNPTGPVASVSLVSPGGGYTNGDIAASGGTGSGAEITVTTTDKPAVAAVFEEMFLEVPILTMVPIPHIRVDYCEIDFHAKITSMEYKNVASQINGSSGFSFKNDTEISASSGSGIIASLFSKSSASFKNTSSVELKVNASYQRSVKEGFKIDKTYQLGVKVRASQDEMPGGMEKILGILEDAIASQPVSIS